MKVLLTKQGTKLKVTSRKDLTLKNVLYLPEIHKNLLFGSLLDSHGFRMVFESDKLFFSKIGVCIGKGYMSN